MKSDDAPMKSGSAVNKTGILVNPTMGITGNLTRLPKQAKAVGMKIDGAELLESSAIAARYQNGTDGGDVIGLKLPDGPGSFIERRGLGPIREQGMRLIGFRRNSRQGPETDARADASRSRIMIKKKKEKRNEEKLNVTPRCPSSRSSPLKCHNLKVPKNKYKSKKNAQDGEKFNVHRNPPPRV
ncbi:hypothetical protein WN51_10308 [Melipona quadrifasciata]|uniref:Uncharacterized protein n=1 Tax=Melipona quadrifasciata TaxID=166423 RepID=A0A0N0BI59_9HYME|nr:hypothetical protein WN51_10308 [Melipona quadrifasciata]